MPNEEDLICRLCLKSCESFLDIFNPDGINGLLVWKIIKELTQLDVSKDDELPKTICGDCMEKIAEFKYFKAKCINSGIELLRLIANRGLVNGRSFLDRQRSQTGFPVVLGGDSKLTSGTSETPAKVREVKPNVSELNRRIAEMNNGLRISEDSVESRSSAGSEDSSQSSGAERRTSLSSLGEHSARTNEIFDGNFLRNLKSPASRLWYARLNDTRTHSPGNESLQGTGTSNIGARNEEVDSKEGILCGSIGTLWQCLECEKVFNSKKGRSAHMKAKHCHDVGQESVWWDEEESSAERRKRRRTGDISSNSEGTAQNAVESQGSGLSMGLDVVQSRRRKRRSAVWKHFTKIGFQMAECKYCPFTTTMPKGTTSALAKHALTHAEHQKRQSGNIHLEIKTPSSAPLNVTDANPLVTTSPTIKDPVGLELKQCHVALIDIMRIENAGGYSNIPGEHIPMKQRCASNVLSMASKNDLNVQCGVQTKNQLKESGRNTTLKHQKASKVTSKAPDFFQLLLYCDTCMASFTSKTELRDHVFQCHVDKTVHWCWVCSKAYKSAFQYEQHVKRHLDEIERYGCKKCRLLFDTKSTLLSHLRERHKGHTSMVCDCCKRGYISEKLFNRHVCNLWLLNYKCRKCGKSWRKLFEYRSHVMICQMGIHLHACPACNKPFLTASYLARHIIIHHAMLRYVCHKCGLRFDHHSRLKIHSKRCGFAFNQMRKKFDSIPRHAEKPIPGAMPKSRGNLGLAIKGSESSALMDVKRGPNVGPKLFPAIKHPSNVASKNSDQSKLPSTKYPCLKCNKVFARRASLSRHYKCHRNLGVHSCPKCPARLKFLGNLANHIKFQHPDYYIDKIIGSKAHTANAKTGNLASTRQPSKKSGAQSLAIDAAKCSDSVGKHLCSVCGNKFLTIQELVTHRKIHQCQTVLRYKCHFCSSSFQTLMNRIVHIRTYHPNAKANPSKKFDAATPMNVVANPLARNKPTRNLNKVRDYNCKIHPCRLCNKVYKMQWALRRHVMDHHSSGKSDPYSFRCQTCGKEFMTARSVNIHQLVHSSEKRFSCTLCSKAFKFWSSCCMHRRRAHPDAPSMYDGRSAPKPIEGKGGVGHLKTLEGNSVASSFKPFGCHFCPKLFKYISNRDRHEKTNHAEDVEKFMRGECHICGNVYSEKRRLYEHVQKHSVVPRFQCRFCDMKFVSRSTCGVHEKRHRRVIP